MERHPVLEAQMNSHTVTIYSGDSVKTIPVSFNKDDIEWKPGEIQIVLVEHVLERAGLDVCPSGRVNGKNYRISRKCDEYPELPVITKSAVGNDWKLILREILPESS